MDLPVIKKIREVFEESGITEYTVEFNNNFNIHFGYEGSYSWWDDENEILWTLNGKTSTFANQHTKGELKAYSYAEIQFIRAGVNYPEIQKVIASTKCEVTDQLTEVVKTICGTTSFRPVGLYSTKDEEGKPQLYNGRPTITTGTE